MPPVILVPSGQNNCCCIEAEDCACCVLGIWPTAFLVTLSGPYDRDIDHLNPTCGHEKCAPGDREQCTDMVGSWIVPRDYSVGFPCVARQEWCCEDVYECDPGVPESGIPPIEPYGPPTFDFEPNDHFCDDPFPGGENWFGIIVALQEVSATSCLITVSPTFGAGGAGTGVGLQENALLGGADFGKEVLKPIDCMNIDLDLPELSEDGECLGGVVDNCFCESGEAHTPVFCNLQSL